MIAAQASRGIRSCSCPYHPGLSWCVTHAGLVCSVPVLLSLNAYIYASQASLRPVNLSSAFAAVAPTAAKILPPTRMPEGAPRIAPSPSSATRHAFFLPHLVRFITIDPLGCVILVTVNTNGYVRSDLLPPAPLPSWLPVVLGDRWVKLQQLGPDFSCRLAWLAELHQQVGAVPLATDVTLQPESWALLQRTRAIMMSGVRVSPQPPGIAGPMTRQDAPAAPQQQQQQRDWAPSSPTVHSRHLLPEPFRGSALACCLEDLHCLTSKVLGRRFTTPSLPDGCRPGDRVLLILGHFETESYQLSHLRQAREDGTLCAAVWELVRQGVGDSTFTQCVLWNVCPFAAPHDTSSLPGGLLAGISAAHVELMHRLQLHVLTELGKVLRISKLASFGGAARYWIDKGGVAQRLGLPPSSVNLDVPHMCCFTQEGRSPHACHYEQLTAWCRFLGGVLRPDIGASVQAKLRSRNLARVEEEARLKGEGIQSEPAASTLGPSWCPADTSFLPTRWCCQWKQGQQQTAEATLRALPAPGDQ